MAQYTENLHLTQPEVFEYYQLEVWNGNLAIIDAFAGTVGAHTGNTNNPHQVTAEQVGACTTEQAVVLLNRIAALETVSDFSDAIVDIENEYFEKSVLQALVCGKSVVLRIAYDCVDTASHEWTDVASGLPHCTDVSFSSQCSDAYGGFWEVQISKEGVLSVRHTVPINAENAGSLNTTVSYFQSEEV